MMQSIHQKDHFRDWIHYYLQQQKQPPYTAHVMVPGPTMNKTGPQSQEALLHLTITAKTDTTSLSITPTTVGYIKSTSHHSCNLENKPRISLQECTFHDIYSITYMPLLRSNQNKTTGAT
jgi:hypothetical protein